jgi:hypothetical protein
MYIAIDKKGNIIAISEKKLSENFIKVEKIPEPFQIYKYINGKFVKDKLKEKEYNTFLKNNLKRKVSKKVTQYIKDLLNYLDYDDIGDLLICKNMSFYKEEVEKIEKWIQKVYKKYEEIISNIDKNKDIDIDNIENLLPKYTG